jgi:VWFA-related protein
MTRILIAIAAAALLAPAQETTSRHLTIDFVALDRNGVPVADLTPSDVEVWIGQFRAPVDTLRLVTPETDERGGRLILLLLDDVTLRPEAMGRVHDAGRHIVTRLGADDRMAVLTLSGSQTETTSDRSRLLRAVDDYATHASGVMRSDTQGRHLLDTLASLSAQIVEAPGRRKTIIGIGPAWLDRPIPPPQAGQDLLPEWIHAMRQMAFSNVNYYVIDPQGLGAAPITGTGDDGFARETGGHAFFNTNDLDAAVDRILRESATYYLVDVSDPPVGARADLRPLEIKSKRKGVTVRARHAIPGSFQPSS